MNQVHYINHIREPELTSHSSARHHFTQPHFRFQSFLQNSEKKVHTSRMHFLPLLSCFLAALAPVSAKPIADCDWDGKDATAARHGCLSDSAAQTIVKTFLSFLVKLDEDVAHNFLADDFKLYSDSHNFVTAEILGGNFTVRSPTRVSKNFKERRLMKNSPD